METEFARRRKQVNVTANVTATRNDSGTHYTNNGAVGPVVITLPLDAGPGDYFAVTMIAAQNVDLNPGAAGQIQLAGVLGTVGQILRSATAGDYVELMCFAGGLAGANKWVARKTGTYSLV